MNLLKRTKAVEVDGPKQEPILRIEVVTHDCIDGEAYIYEMPADTYWGAIQDAIRLFHPDCKSVWIQVEE